ncbi:MAG: ATP-binding cassette domain-containing protein, partial [Candidatus Rokuibacteriota bacterium]
TCVCPAFSLFYKVLSGFLLPGGVGWGAAFFARGRVGREERRQHEEALAILESVGVSARVDEQACALSTGVLRRVEISIVVAARPKLLLLDEPASGMTPAEKEEVGALIGRVRAAGTDVFLVEHDMRLVMGISDRVLVLNHGQLIADGPPAAVRRDPAVIRAYLGSSGAAAADLEAARG